MFVLLSGTLFWDNAFSADRREAFEVPQAIHRNTFLQNLQLWFQCRTGRALNNEQLFFLQQCLPEQVTVNQLVEITECNKELRFAFWFWFYKCTMLICKNDQVRTFWQNGWLRGFISHRDACSLLQQCPVGYALVRFCTRAKKGAIAVLQLCVTDAIEQIQAVHKYGCWKLRDLRKPDLFTSLFDLQIDFLAPNVNWIAELRLERSLLLNGEVEQDESADEQVEQVPTRLRRCRFDSLSWLLAL